MTTTNALLDSYLQSRESTARIQTLSQLKSQGQTLPVALVDDILAMDISDEESTALLSLANPSNPLALEHLLTANLAHWDQKVGVAATREWASRCPGILSHRFPALARLKHLPQRLRYTILDISHRAGGVDLIRACLESEGLEELSPAFHALLFIRGLQWNLGDPRLTTLAKTILSTLAQDHYPESRAFAPACGWLARFEPTSLRALCEGEISGEYWPQLIRSMLEAHDKKSENDRWSPLWSRHMMEADQVKPRLKQVFKDATFPANAWMAFAGIPADTLKASAFKITSPNIFLNCVRGLGSLLDPMVDEPFLARVLDSWKSLPDSERLPEVADRLRALAVRQPLLRPLFGDDPSVSIAASEYDATRLSPLAVLSSPLVATALQAVPSDDPERSAFFDLVRGRKTPHTAARPGPSKDSFWRLLAEAWTNPTEAQLQPLTVAARKHSGLFTLAYLQTMARFRHASEAAPKLLDFIRTEDPQEQRAVVRALGGIATPRALQELVAWLTRPKTPLALQMEICQSLRGSDLTTIQHELRSALHDLNLQTTPVNDPKYGLYETLESMLVPEASAPHATEAPSHSKNSSPGADSAEEVDTRLGRKIPGFKTLSGEVKRAMRTAEFFTEQALAGNKGSASIDLSPAIDMQYKALEIYFRENFEEPCSRVIHQGAIQRKLDVIGYARPIPASMDRFENFIGGLPIVRDIPFFSKFKLRKMLQALCQFRPGKRFTLDGLKAFGLFFLCFGRKECPFGLANLYPMPFKDDAELANFSRLLHLFQDTRNRAVHEGLPPDARQDINNFWRMTAEIIQEGARLKSAERPSTPARGPIIERRS